MNLLFHTFEKYFYSFYYYDNSGRAYLEYSCSSCTGFEGKIGFFHFSLEDKKKNIFFNYKIYLFIKEFYSESFPILQEILEYCVQQGITISLISLNEKEFLLRVSGGDTHCRNIIADIYKKSTGKEFIFPHTNFTCPIELDIKNTMVVALNIFQKVALPGKIDYEASYLEEDNIFLTVLCREYIEEKLLQQSYLFKLYEPINIKKSSFLLKTYSPYIESYFDTHKIFVSCIEKKEKEDVIYFTQNYPIEA